MYKIGVLCQGFTCVAICSVCLYVLQFNHAPNFKWQLHPITIVLSLLAVILVISIYFETAQMYCKYYREDIPDDEDYIVTATYIANMFPMIFALGLCFFLWLLIWIIFRQKAGMASPRISKVLDRVFCYVLIFTIGWSGTAIIVIYTLSRDFNSRESDTVIVISGLGQGFSGTFFCIQYIYFFEPQSDEERPTESLMDSYYGSSGRATEIVEKSSLNERNEEASRMYTTESSIDAKTFCSGDPKPYL